MTIGNMRVRGPFNNPRLINKTVDGFSSSEATLQRDPAALKAQEWVTCVHAALRCARERLHASNATPTRQQRLHASRAETFSLPPCKANTPGFAWCHHALNGPCLAIMFCEHHMIVSVSACGGMHGGARITSPRECAADP